MKHQQKNFYKLTRVYLFLVVILCSWPFICKTANAQELESAQAQKAFENAVKVYDSYLGKNTFLYVGSSYVAPYSGIKGHQFFIDDYWEQGDIVYDKVNFDSIYIKYDVYKDILIIENFGLNGLPSHMKLYGPKVTSFRLHGYNFIRLQDDTQSNMKEGYYNILYDGTSIQAFAKRKKDLVTSNEINTIKEMFVEKDRFYIKKDGKFYQVKNNRSIKKVLGDRKKEVQTYIKSNNIYFKWDPDGQLIEVAKYYDSLF
jgi:hypothetical protein